jgi:hypothetical protein
MSDRYHTDPFDDSPGLRKEHPPLPGWLAARVLRPDERCAWVYGPRFNPSWERFVTHPSLLVSALALGGICLLMGRLRAGSWVELPVVSGLAAGAVVLGSILVLAFFSGYFTRLVVTNFRLVILQGYEVCRTWRIDQLPRSLVRYGMRGIEDEEPSIDLDSLKTMLGSTSDRFAESKTILAFGKQLEQIRTRKGQRP